eukprot:scaffold7284_cov115-Isochrysis_galbana.AAC.8
MRTQACPFPPPSLGANVSARIGRKRVPSESVRPHPRAPIMSAVMPRSVPVAIWAQYLRSTPVDGSSRRRARGPEVVSRRRPSVAISSRPTVIMRGSPGGRAEWIVGRPCGSERVVMSPVGL